MRGARVWLCPRTDVRDRGSAMTSPSRRRGSAALHSTTTAHVRPRTLRGLALCKTRACPPGGPGLHPEHPTAVEGCRPASRSCSLELLTCGKYSRPPRPTNRVRTPPIARASGAVPAVVAGQGGHALAPRRGGRPAAQRCGHQERQRVPGIVVTGAVDGDARAGAVAEQPRDDGRARRHRRDVSRRGRCARRSDSAVEDATAAPRGSQRDTPTARCRARGRRPARAARRAKRVRPDSPPCTAVGEKPQDARRCARRATRSPGRADRHVRGGRDGRGDEGLLDLVRAEGCSSDSRPASGARPRA